MSETSPTISLEPPKLKDASIRDALSTDQPQNPSADKLCKKRKREDIDKICDGIFLKKPFILQVLAQLAT
jgi:hypothetical protein